MLRVQGLGFWGQGLRSKATVSNVIRINGMFIVLILVTSCSFGGMGFGFRFSWLPSIIIFIMRMRLGFSVVFAVSPHSSVAIVIVVITVTSYYSRVAQACRLKQASRASDIGVSVCRC